MQLSLHCLGCLSLYFKKKNIGIGFLKIPKFVISSFRHIFSIDMPTTLNWNEYITLYLFPMIVLKLCRRTEILFLLDPLPFLQYCTTTFPRISLFSNRSITNYNAVTSYLKLELKWIYTFIFTISNNSFKNF